MINPLLPGRHPRTEIIIQVPYRIEQHEEEQVKHELSNPNLRWYHDPFWNRRFWSIQHVHDCIEGKTFHWFWSPFSEVFNLAQLMFMILPFAAYMNDHGQNIGIRGMILFSIAMQVAASLSKHLWRWYNDWRFKRTPYRIIRHVSTD